MPTSSAPASLADSFKFLPKQLGTTLLLFAIFVGIPLFLGIEAGWYSLNRAEESLARKKSQRFEQILDHLAIQQDAESCFVGRSLHRLFLEVRRLWADQPHVKRYHGWAVKDLGPHVWYYVLQQGRISYRVGPAFNDRLIEPLIKGLSRPMAHNRTLARRLDPSLRKTFGNHVSLAYLQKRNGELIPIMTQNGPGVACFETRPDGFGMVMFANQIPQRHLDELLRLRQREKPWRRFFGTAFPETEIWNPPTGIPPQVMKTAFFLAGDGATRQADVGGYRWLFSRDRYGKVLSLTLPIAWVFPETKPLRIILILTALLLALWGAWFIHRLVESPALLSTPIKHQLWFLFAYSTLLPMLAAILLDGSACRIAETASKIMLLKPASNDCRFSKVLFPKPVRKFW